MNGDVETIHSAQRAAAVLGHPVRARILAAAQTAVSAADLARRLGQPRQRINYHVRQLARAGFLKPAAQRRKRNMVEQQYVASARAYVLAPAVLGEVAIDPAALQDTASAAHLIGLCATAQAEVGAVMKAANSAGLRVRTMSLQSDLRFTSSEQRSEFTRELLESVSEVVARHSSPFTRGDAARAPGHPFRLILGCYPIPGEDINE